MSDEYCIICKEVKPLIESKIYNFRVCKDCETNTQYWYKELINKKETKPFIFR